MKKMIHFTTTLILMTCPLLGQATEYSYDNLNRLSKATYANGDFVTYNYDAGGNIIEIMSHTQNPDADGDGMPDSWEIANRLDPYDANDAKANPDNDRLTNLDEYLNKTDPYKQDALVVFDNFEDGSSTTAFIPRSSSKSQASLDTDKDGMPDSDELKYKTNPKDGSDCPPWYCQGFSK